MEIAYLPLALGVADLPAGWALDAGVSAGCALALRWSGGGERGQSGNESDGELHVEGCMSV